MDENIKEIKINVGTRDIYLTSEECVIVKEVLDSLHLETTEDEGLKAEDSSDMHRYKTMPWTNFRVVKSKSYQNMDMFWYDYGKNVLRC